MTPVIDDVTHHFEWRALYDGASILWDRESGSIWHHVTGQCLYGPLEGTKLGGSGNLLHMSVKQALALYPDIQVALSDRPLREERNRFWPLAEQVPMLPERFTRTMAGEDTRRPTMDVGMGVWTATTKRYYPLEYVLAQDDFVIDDFESGRLLVYFDPQGHALSALYTQATSAEWSGAELLFSDGAVIRAGVLYGPEGDRRQIQRPLQVFTRWYGFALMFPETEVYEGQ